MEATTAAWRVAPSDMARRIKNPIREIVDNTKLDPNPALPVIPLSIGFKPVNSLNRDSHLLFVLYYDMLL